MKQLNTPADTPVFELKGSVLTIITLHILKTHPDYLYPQLVKKIGQARSFFKGAPLLLDLSAVNEEDQTNLDFRRLVTTLREFSLVPVGVRGCSDSQSERVLQAGLGILPAIKTKRTVESLPEEQTSPPDSLDSNTQSQVPDHSIGESQTVASTKVVSHPVRSGQQLFAPEGDLVILSSVNAGAEVLAAGNIHVYGALRGRAMAGINGDSTARIFSLRCNPELVAIAGEYMVNESIDQAVVDQSAIISLQGDDLNFEVVGSFKPIA